MTGMTTARPGRARPSLLRASAATAYACKDGGTEKTAGQIPPAYGRAVKAMDPVHIRPRKTEKNMHTGKMTTQTKERAQRIIRKH